MRLYVLSQIVFLLLSLPLWAAPTQPTQEAVDATLTTALKQFKAKHPAEALTHLEQALAQSTQWPGYQARIQFFRARCLIDLHRPDEARVALERFIALSTDREDKRRGRTWLAKLQRRFYGSVRVVCVSAAQRVSISGVPGKPRRCPAQWDNLKPGQYQITITGAKKTAKPTEISVEILAGQRLTHDLKKKTQKRTKIVAPTPMVMRWGVFARAGLGLPRGTIPQSASLDPGLSAELGAWSSLIWPLSSAIGLGLRVELGYRLWTANVSGAGHSQTVVTHGVVLPLLAQLDLPWRLSMRLGVAPSFNLLAKADDLFLDRNPLGLLALGGLAWRLPIKALDLSANLRYGFDLTDSFERATLRRDQVQLGLAWGF